MRQKPPLSAMIFGALLTRMWTQHVFHPLKHMLLRAFWGTMLFFLMLMRGGVPIEVWILRHTEAAGNLKEGQRGRLYTGKRYVSQGQICNNTGYDPPTIRGLYLIQRLDELLDRLLGDRDPDEVAALSSTAVRTVLAVRGGLKRFCERNGKQVEVRQAHYPHERDGAFDNTMQDLADVRKRSPWSVTKLYRRYDNGDSIFMVCFRFLWGLFEVMWKLPRNKKVLVVGSHTWPIIGFLCWVALKKFDPDWMEEHKSEVKNCAVRKVRIGRKAEFIGDWHYPNTDGLDDGWDLSDEELLALLAEQDILGV